LSSAGPATALEIYAGCLSELVRVGLAAGDPNLAARLVAGVKPVWPAGEHALASARASLAEEAGETEAAAAGYADAARRWGAFGVVAEQAFALLGQGRCLARLGRRAEEPLEQARAIFGRLGAEPWLRECDALMAQVAGSS
jgi:hypothetical protein